MKKYLGSTVVLIFGVLSVVVGLAKPSSVLLGGIIMVLGALAYRSAKRRKLGEVKTSVIRKAVEVIAIVIIIALVLLQHNAADYIRTDPVPNLIIPLWAIIAYAVIAFKKKRGS